MKIWTIYKKPSDFPNHFVARPHLVVPNQSTPLQEHLIADTLEELREKLPPGLYRTPRNPDDDATIVEVWI